jgi:hypothetical protein
MTRTEEIRERLAQDARDAWQVTVETHTVDRHFQTAVRYVEAEADTGTRYVVVASYLPEGHREGGDVLVTVLHPWSDSHTMSPDPEKYLAESYVAEHLCAGRGRAHDGRLARVLSPEDLAALTMTVRYALGRNEHG